jgi:hypothetical protein
LSFSQGVTTLRSVGASGGVLGADIDLDVVMVVVVNMHGRYFLSADLGNLLGIR